MCDQQSLRSACAYAQSDQSLCLSLECSLSGKLLTEHHLEFLSLKEGCRGSSESILVKMSNCWKSHAAAALMSKIAIHFLSIIGSRWCYVPKRTVPSIIFKSNKLYVTPRSVNILRQTSTRSSATSRRRKWFRRSLVCQNFTKSKITSSGHFQV